MGLREDYTLVVAAGVATKGPEAMRRAYQRALLSGPPEGMDPAYIEGVAASIRASYGEDPLRALEEAYRESAQSPLGRGISPLPGGEARRTYQSYLGGKDGEGQG